MNKLELKAAAYDIILSMDKKQKELQALQQQLNEVNTQLSKPEEVKPIDN